MPPIEDISIRLRGEDAVVVSPLQKGCCQLWRGLLEYMVWCATFCLKDMSIPLARTRCGCERAKCQVETAQAVGAAAAAYLRWDIF